MRRPRGAVNIKSAPHARVCRSSPLSVHSSQGVPAPIDLRAVTFSSLTLSNQYTYACSSGRRTLADDGSPSTESVRSSHRDDQSPLRWPSSSQTLDSRASSALRLLHPRFTNVLITGPPKGGPHVRGVRSPPTWRPALAGCLRSPRTWRPA